MKEKSNDIAGITAYNIRKFRKKKGMTQQELADALKMHKQQISNWERGLFAPRKDNLIKIANALDINYISLLKEDETYRNDKKKDEDYDESLAILAKVEPRVYENFGIDAGHEYTNAINNFQELKKLYKLMHQFLNQFELVEKEYSK